MGSQLRVSYVYIRTRSLTAPKCQVFILSPGKLSRNLRFLPNVSGSHRYWLLDIMPRFQVGFDFLFFFVHVL